MKINVLATGPKRKNVQNEPDALRQRAAAALRNEKTDETVAICRQLLRSEPNYQPWQSLSICYRLQGDDR